MNINILPTAARTCGAIMTAVGVALLIGFAAEPGTLEDEFVRPPFVPAMFVALALYGLMLFWWRTDASARWRPWRHFTQSTLASAAVVFALFAVGIPCCQHPARSYTTAMKSDLRNLAQFEREFRADSGRYTQSLGGFKSSRDVTAPVINLTRDGWTASVGHERTKRECAIFVGRTPLAPATVEDKPECTPAATRELDLSGLSWGVGILAVGIALGIAGSLGARPKLPSA